MQQAAQLVLGPCCPALIWHRCEPEGARSEIRVRTDHYLRRNLPNDVNTQPHPPSPWSAIEIAEPYALTKYMLEALGRKPPIFSGRGCSRTSVTTRPSAWASDCPLTLSSLGAAGAEERQTPALCQTVRVTARQKDGPIGEPAGAHGQDKQRFTGRS